MLSTQPYHTRHDSLLDTPKEVRPYCKSDILDSVLKSIGRVVRAPFTKSFEVHATFVS